MENSKEYYQQFYQEAMEFRKELEDFIAHWSSYLEDDEAKARLCRLAHSLKSGGAFLGLKRLEESAHALEDMLQSNGPMDNRAKAGTSQLHAILQESDLGGIDGSVLSEGSTVVSAAQGAPNHQGLPWLKMVNSRLLNEARQRNDRLYRVDCRLQPQEAMKRARAFLILSNLEMNCMVIGSIPSVENKEADFSIFSIFLFSSMAAKAIKKFADVDQVEEIRIREIPRQDWDSLRNKEFLLQPMDLRSSGEITLQRNDLNELMVLWEELIESLKGSRWAAEKGRRLAGILRQGRSKMEKISYFSFKELEEQLQQGLRIASQSRDSSIELEVQGGNLLMPREWQNPLKQILQQLIRNTVVHGIESTVERQSQGKAPTGKITVELSEEKDRIILAYKDDGRGIQREELIKRAQSMDESQSLEGLSLKELLEIRGLSSAGQLSLQGGRGVGMELFSQLVEKELQGHWSVETLDQGCRFQISLPAVGRSHYLKFRSKKNYYLLSSLYISHQAAFDVENIWKKKSGDLFYKTAQSYLPIFTVEGPVKNLSELRSCAQWVQMEYLGKKACLAVEELLAKESYIKDSILEKDDISEKFPWMKKIDGDLFVLLPKLIE